MYKLTSDNNQQMHVLMSDGLWLTLYDINKSHDVINSLIHKYGLRVSDTSMSYRQINYLDNAGLIGSQRKDGDNKWRLFKFRDAVYLNLIFELKKFGIRNEQLKVLYDLFYKSEKTADFVIIACLAGAEMTLILDSNGFGTIYAPNYLELHDTGGLLENSDGFAEIRVKLNDAVNKTLIEGGVSARNIKIPVSKFRNVNQSEAETKVVEALRNSDFEEIKIKKKDGKPYVLFATDIKRSNISPTSIISAISSQQYADLQIVKRDGKVVHYKQEVAIKL